MRTARRVTAAPGRNADRVQQPAIVALTPERTSHNREMGDDRHMERVIDPDSLGVHVLSPDEAELVVVLFRGGWADVDYMVSVDDAGVIRGSTDTGAPCP